jgi:hypothetical protein
MWQAQGKQGEAYTLLGGIYNQITEGFDTDDLKATGVLLIEFASTPKEHSTGQNCPVGDAGRV